MPGVLIHLAYIRSAADVGEFCDDDLATLLKWRFVRADEAEGVGVGGSVESAVGRTVDGLETLKEKKLLNLVDGRNIPEQERVLIAESTRCTSPSSSRRWRWAWAPQS